MHVGERTARDPSERFAGLIFQRNARNRFASGLVVDAAVTGDTIYSFKVMLVPEVQLGARRDARLS